ncbi:MAG: TIGR04552 family protein [Polyangiaceae bacterium]
MKSPDEFSLADLEALRLLLRGDSIIDWHRLNFVDASEARELLRAQELDPDAPRDRERLETIQSEAVAFLRRRFDLAIPQPVEEASVEELMLLASSKGHRQVCACTILKAMHIIHHLDGRELAIMLPMSSQEIFRLVEEKVYRVIGGMLAVGSPIDEFIGGRKNKDSLCTKLLSKQETIAAAVYDKLRFRIVCRTSSDLMPVLSFLHEELFPSTTWCLSQARTPCCPSARFVEAHERLRPLVEPSRCTPTTT